MTLQEEIEAKLNQMADENCETVENASEIEAEIKVINSDTLSKDDKPGYLA